MFRLSQYMRLLAALERGESPPPAGPPPAAPVVIWNLLRRCNLTCRHCYAVSADGDFKGELDSAAALTLLDDLHAAGVRVLILSGGEPLLRADLWQIAARARALGFHLSLSSNGTLIDAEAAARIAAIGFDYVGISLDGIGATHDRFRCKPGAFDASLAALRRLIALGQRVGVRYTLTAANAADLEALLELCRDEGVGKFYFSHLNYAGRGNKNRAGDAEDQTTRSALALLFARAWSAAQRAGGCDFVTGNNDADGVFLLHWARARLPQHVEALAARLRAWGGNASGQNVANIDNLGNVHPDSMWWHHTLGNVRERRFGEIWQASTDPLMAGLRQRPRPVQGRCGRCAFLAICNGNTRTRAHRVSGDYWAEDPGCYLSDAEIGLNEARPACVVEVAP